MTMTSRRATIALGVVGVLAGTISLASNASGSSSAKRGIEHLTLTDKITGAKSSPIKVVARGPINGVGTAQIKSQGNGLVDHFTLRLAEGSVHLVATEKSFSLHLNAAKCTGINVGHGVFTITGSTRAFHGIAGHGTYHRTTHVTGARDASGNCLKSAPPSAVRDHVELDGKVSVP